MMVSSLQITGLAQEPSTTLMNHVITVDHVAIAVQSLEEAELTYERIGFRLKPGRLHANGLRNSFAKFEGGTYLELISPQSGAVDQLTGTYVEQLRKAEGGTFLAFQTDSISNLAQILTNNQIEYNIEVYRGAFSTLAFQEPSLESFFLIEYLAPVVDSPELLDHPNTAMGIETVWVRENDYTSFTAVSTFEEITGIAAAMQEDKSTPIAGVTLLVRNIETARAVIRNGTGLDLSVQSNSRGVFIRVPAHQAHGMWIEFLEISS